MKQNKILFVSKSTFLVFLIFFIFSGCGLKQESLSINHYGIDFKTLFSFTKSNLSFKTA